MRTHHSASTQRVLYQTKFVSQSSWTLRSEKGTNHDPNKDRDVTRVGSRRNAALVEQKKLELRNVGMFDPLALYSILHALQLRLRTRSRGIKCPQESVAVILPKRIESEECDDRIAGREDACLVRSAGSTNRQANML